MKVSDYVIDRLAREGIDTAFLVQGGANNDLIYSIADHPEMRYTCAGHEQGAGFAAEGWAKVRDDGTPGLAIATSGPGGQNLLTAVANCFYDSTPAIFLTGQVGTKFLRPDAGVRQVGFQECDVVAMARSVTKHAELVRRPEDVPYALDHALWLAREGRPGPVLLDLPVDVQRAGVDPATAARFDPPLPLRPLRGQAIDRFLDDLERAERPVILVGGGVRGAVARAALDAVATTLRVPLLPTWNALDTVASDHPWYGGRVGTYGGAGRNLAIQNSDLLLAVGCRLSGRVTGGRPETFARGARRYAVDVDPAAANLAPPAGQPFHAVVEADAAEFLRDLAAAWWRRYPGVNARHEAWRDQVEAWRDRYDPVRSEHGARHPYRFVRELSRRLPANAVIVADCGGNVVTVGHALETQTGQRYFTSNGNSPMGFALAGAVGAWHADRNRPVYCVIGDGGFALSAPELAMLRETGADVRVFVLNNHGYGITRAFQETNGAGRAEASTPASGVWLPEVIKLARAYDLPAFDSRAMTLEQLVEFPGPVVFDVDVGDHHEYAPRIFGWDTPLEDLYPYLPRDEFRANLIGVDPLPGWETPPEPGA